MFFPDSPGPAVSPRVRAFLCAGLLLALLIATRWPLAPRYLYYFDSINFALAMDHFDPWHHQPQPPGYPLFVGALRLVHTGFDDPQQTLVATGILIALAALLLTRAAAARIFDSAVAGWLAVALLIANPPFWLGGVTNQVRLCLAMCSAGIALAAWRALRTPDESRWLYLAFAVLGVGAGFRPVDCVLLAPLLLWAWFVTGRDPRRLAVGVASAAAAALPWVAVTAWAVGGPARWVYLMWTYGRDQFRGTSALFGAPTASAGQMALQAVVWTGLGVLTWFWAIPLARNFRQSNDPDRARFLAAWMLPPFVFALLVHIGDPDQALTVVTPLCVLGGGVLARAASGTRFLRPGALAPAVALANAVLFFVPLGQTAGAATWNVVRVTDERLRSAFEALEAVRGTGPAAILHYGSEVTWRHIFYYFPSDYLVYLPQDRRELSMSFRGRQLLSEGMTAAALPSVRRVLVLAPHLNPGWMAEHGWQARGPVYWRDVANTGLLQVGDWTLPRLTDR